MGKPEDTNDGNQKIPMRKPENTNGGSQKIPMGKPEDTNFLCKLHFSSTTCY
jgi:hypothetical protein